MVPREKDSFVFFDFFSGNIRTLSPLNNHIAKTNTQRRRADNCAIVSRSGYNWIWSGECDQESTNHSAYFVEWKSSYITICFIWLCSINQEKICWFLRKLQNLVSKLTEDPSLDDANEIFYSITKNANLMLLETSRRALTGRDILWLLTRPENHFDSNQICFYSYLSKVF